MLIDGFSAFEKYPYAQKGQQMQVTPKTKKKRNAPFGIRTRVNGVKVRDP